MSEAGSPLAAARTAKSVAVADYGNLPQVNGIGITQVAGHYAIKINLCAAEDGPSVFPDQINGIPVTLDVAGKIVLC